MFQSLDTAIGFVVIMTVASLLVTIVVQIFSAALSLRGKNLANALALTFQTIDPSLGEKAHHLAAKILCDPLLSDSTRTVKNRSSGPTIAPRDRPWHFTDIFGATRLANAVRSEEVYATLQRLAAEQEGADKTARSILNALAATRQGAARAKFDAFFSSAQDRARQWFQLHVRGLTIAASVFFAFLCQLDAVEIFRFVSINAASRTALISSADRVIREADGALDEKGGLIKRIADAWSAEQNAPPADLAGVTHTGQLEARLRETNASLSADEFDRVARAATTAYYHDQRAKLRELTRGAGATGFEFIPLNFWRWPSRSGLEGSLTNIIPHIPGIALCAALLALGAPYWYNLLKNLTSLRPALSQLIGREEGPSVNPKPIT